MIRSTRQLEWFSGGRRRTDLVAFRPGLLLRDVVDRDAADSAGLVLFRNGRRAGPDDLARDGDVVRYGVAPGDPTGVYVSLFLISIILGSVVSNFLAPPRRRGDDSSPVHAFSGTSPNRSEGEPIPIYIGRDRRGGQILAEFFESKGRLGSIYNVLIGFGYGPIYAIAGITEDTDPDQPLRSGATGDLAIPDGIFINDSQANQYAGVEVHIRLGTSEQKPIVGFERDTQTITVGRDFTAPPANSSSALEFFFDRLAPSPAEDALFATYGISIDLDDVDRKVDAATFVVEFVAGLFSSSTSTGDVLPWGASFAIRYIELDSLGIPITTGGPFADGWVRLRPTPLFFEAIQGPFPIDFTVPFYDPATFALPQLGTLLSVNFESSFVQAWAEKTSPTLPAAWTAGADLDSFTVGAWVVLRPNGANTGSNSGVTDLSNVIDNPILSLFDAATSRGFKLVLGTRSFQLSPGQTRTRIVPILVGGDGTTVREFYQRNASGQTSGIATETGDVTFRATVHGQNDVPTIDYARIVATYEADVRGTDDRLRVFAQGELVLEVVGALSFKAPTATLFLCRDALSDGTNQRFFKGHLDEVLLVNRAWNQTEVERDFNTGRGVTHASAADYVALYHFDNTPAVQGNGTTSPDSGPRANTLTLRLTSGASDLVRSGSISSIIDRASATNVPKRSNYRLQIARATRDVASAQRVDDSRLVAVQSHVDEQQSYPGEPCLAIRIPASAALSGSAPNVTAIVDGLLFPVWRGTDTANPTSSLEYTRNPAWVALGLATSPEYGAGQVFHAKGQVLADAAEFAERCEELVYNQKGRTPIDESDASAPFSDLQYDSTLDDGNGGILLIGRVGKPLPAGYEVGGFLGFRGLSVSGTVSIDLSVDGPDGITGLEILEIRRTGSYNLVLRWPTAELGAPWPDGQFYADASTDLLAGTIEGREERFLVDLNIDTARPAWEWLQAAASVGRGYVVDSRAPGSGFRIRWDAPRVPVDMISKGTTKRGTFRYAWQGPSLRENAYDSFIRDEALNYERSPVSLEHPSVQASTSNGAVRRKGIELIGCTRRSQARRELLYRLNRNHLIIERGRAELLIDMLDVSTTDVLLVASDLVPFGDSGRIAEAPTTTSVTFDRRIVLEPAVAYKLVLRNSAGAAEAPLESLDVVSPAGTYEIGDPIDLAAAPGFVPQRDDPYILHAVGSEREVVVRSISLSQSLTRVVEIEQNVPEVHDDEEPLGGIPVELLVASTSSDPADDAPPRNATRVAARERLARTNGSSLRAALAVTWEHDEETVGRIAQTILFLSEEGGRFEEVARASGVATNAAVPISAVRPGARYRVAVQPVTHRGARLPPEACASTTVLVYGTAPEPAAPSDLVANIHGALATYSWVDGDPASGAGFDLRAGGWKLGVPIITAPPGTSEIASPAFFAVIASSKGPAAAKLYLRARASSGYLSDTAKLSVSLEPDGAEALVAGGGATPLYEVAWEDYGTGFDGGSPATTLADFQVGAGGWLEFAGSALEATFTTALPDPGAGAGSPYKPMFVSCYVEADQQHPMTWAEANFAWDAPEASQWTWEGPLVDLGDDEDPGSCSLSIEFRVFDDAYAPGPWMPYRPGVVLCTAAQFRITATRPTTDFDVRIRRVVTVLRGVPARVEPHAASHQDGGSDEIATATPSANAIPKAGASGKLAAGWIPTLDLVPTPVADVALGAHKITGLADPSSAQDAATKAYVDAVALGLDVKPSVLLATTANITLSGARTVDSVSTGTGDRILVKNQSTASQNGIYIANTGGAWARATDADAWSEIPGAFVFVEQGLTQADTGWVCTADSGGTLGSTAMPWVQFSSAGVPSAGTGLTQTGLVFSANFGTSAGTVAQGNDARFATPTDAELAAIAGLTSAADKGLYFTGSGTASTYDFTAFARSMLDDATAADVRTTLGLGTLATQSGTFSGTSSGTNTGDQTITLTGGVTGSGTGSFAATVITNADLTGPITSVGNATTIADAELAALAGLTSAANKIPRFTGSGTADLVDASATPAATTIPISASDKRLALGFMRPPQFNGQVLGFYHDTGATTVTAVGMPLTFTQQGTGTTVASADTTAGRYELQQTAATTNSVAGRISSGVVTQRQWAETLVGRFATRPSILNVRHWKGYSDSDLSGVTTPTTQHVAAFRYDTGTDGTAFFRTVTCDGTTATVTTTSTAIAVSSFYRVRIELDASEVRFYLDDALVATHTTNLPGAAIGLKIHSTITTLANSAKGELWGDYQVLKAA